MEMLKTRNVSTLLLLQAALLRMLASCEESFTALPKPSEPKAHSVLRTVHKRPSPAQLPEPSTGVRNILESFQVNENRIIRTEDSRRMGATFLNETERGSNRDCLIWCWETTNCNVAVYEEKSKGSCYLFDCGPPSAFLCLFTSHTFYTSSLLLAGPREAQYSQWGLPSRHEDELTQLRQVPQPPRPQQPTKVPQVISQQNERPAAPVQTSAPTGSNGMPTVTPTRPEAHCQRYQFQCQNSSECIAVYNVCDGIPQCPDGSDESDDLNCPGAKMVDEATTTPGDPTTSLLQTAVRTRGTTTLAPPPPQAGDETAVSPPSRALPPPQSGDALDHEQRMPYSYRNVTRGKSSTTGGRLHAFNRKPGLPPLPASRDGPDGWPGRDPRPPAQRPDYAPYGGGDPYLGYQDKYDDYSIYADNGRLWVGDDDGQLYPVGPEGVVPPRQMRPPNQRGGLRQVLPSRYAQQEIQQQRQFHRQQILQQQQFQHQLQQQKQLAAMQSYSRGDDWRRWRHRPAADQPETAIREPPYVQPRVPLAYEGVRRHAIASPPPVSEGRSVPPPRAPGSDAAPSSTRSAAEAEPVVPPTDDDGGGENLYEPVVEVGPPPVLHQGENVHSSKHASKTKDKARPASQHQPAAPSSMQFGRLSEVANMRVSFTQVEQAGREANRESSSAVLALVLGLCVTGLLLVLVGCRLRLARHRLARRGGRSTLAHDADYLVNGMYL